MYVLDHNPIHQPPSDVYGGLLIIGVIILYCLFLFIRYKTNIRLYNFFAIGIVMFLALQFPFLPLTITFICLILFHLYDTFGTA